MITITEPVCIDADPILPEGLSASDCIFFDIETTGLSADTSSLYLISVLTFSANVWTLHQWFADDYDSEPQILTVFGEMLKGAKAVVQYNGDTFDVPYLEAKWRAHHMPYSFSGIVLWDIYRKIRPFSFLLKTPNLKLKTMEELLGIYRKDPYNGGELITVYGTFLRAHYCNKPTEEFLAPLLLHNREDVLSLPALTTLIGYASLQDGTHRVANVSATDTQLVLTLNLSHTLPQNFTFRGDHCFFEGTQDQLQIRVDYLEEELKYFFPDYKDYYYLPVEDPAVHKSVGEFVDKEYRQKATAATCYIRKAGRFLPVDETFATQTRRLFRRDYKSKEHYLLWEDTLLEDADFLHAYASALLAKIKKPGKK